MPKQRKNEQIRCPHFTWKLARRNNVWYADGRSNSVNAGRHSLGTKSKEVALRQLPGLDQARAEDLGLIPKPHRDPAQVVLLLLEEGRKLYEQHIARPQLAGGLRKSSLRRYRGALNKFLPYAKQQGITTWNGVTETLLTEYIAFLEAKNAPHTIKKDLVIVTGAHRWLITADHIHGVQPINLKFRAGESQAHYCYSPQQVKAMLEQSREDPSLRWLELLIVGLACTGLRIEELLSLRWTDIDLEKGRLELTDESGHCRTDGTQLRQTKSGRSRTLSIHPDLLAMLRDIVPKKGFVFHSQKDGRIDARDARGIFVSKIIEPLAVKYPERQGSKTFADARFHSFRHYFCSTCANNSVPERIVMTWLGHSNSEMIRHYYHLHDLEAKRRMDSLNFLGECGGWSTGQTGDNNVMDDAGPGGPETRDNRDTAD